MRLPQRLFNLLGLAGAGLALVATATALRAEQPDFATWLADFKQAAAAAGISRTTIEAALTDLTPIERILELDHRQPEFTQTFWSYLDKRVTPGRIERGRRLLAKHRELLDRVRRRYGVQPRFLVAFWGLESNFGDYTGGFPVIGALATLAHDPRRGAFFRRQLLDALKILDQGHVAPSEMSGSWAGAMGQPQFIPSTFLGHAVDFDGDRRRDIWNSLPDVFASAAHYLSNVGWRGDEIWGREVRLPPDFDWDLVGRRLGKPLAEWQRRGLRRADGGDLPRAAMNASLIVPAGQYGPAFLVYRNFNAILAWNRSDLYALAVGHLADRLVGHGPLQAARPAREPRLRRSEIEEMQSLLARLGFDPGASDGLVGSKTRVALRNFQRRAELTPDGYPTPAVLDRLRGFSLTRSERN